MNPASSFLDEAASGGPECGDASGLQPTHVGPRHPMAELQWLPGTAHIVQGPSADLQSSSWICFSYLNQLVGVHLTPHLLCSTHEHGYPDCFPTLFPDKGTTFKAVRAQVALSNFPLRCFTQMHLHLKVIEY